MPPRYMMKLGLAALTVFVCGCSTRPSRAPAIAEAYVGPALLNVRGDIPLDSKPVATVKHGDKLQILARRRKFLRVRTAGGAEGWTDERLLLGESDMADLRNLAARAAKMPSQGVATVYREINVHTQPSSGSPSFLRLKEGEKFDVVAEIVADRKELPRQPLIPPPAKKKKAEAPKKPKKESKIPPPPMPAPPGLPSNWLDLSKSAVEEDEGSEEPPKPIPTDYWSLVRAAGGQSGWVLTRFISMAIPDEVAQYAEGHRIVSYYALGSVDDDGTKKPIWLWTTVRGRQPFDFDSFRVFIWSLKRHRYETAYIGRNVEGYWPVLLNPVSYAVGKAGPEKYPGFSVCLAVGDGRMTRREYALIGNVVRYAGEGPCELPPPVWVAKTGTTLAIPESPAAAPGVWERMKGWFRRRKGA